jgi:hypothetical protein
MRATRASILKAGRNWPVGQGLTRGTDFVDGQTHPQLGGLVLDDEQHLVMGVGPCLLRVQDQVQRQVIAIGHAPVKGHLRALAGGIIGGFGHGGLMWRRRGVLPSAWRETAGRAMDI